MEPLHITFTFVLVDTSNWFILCFLLSIVLFFFGLFCQLNRQIATNTGLCWGTLVAVHANQRRFPLPLPKPRLVTITMNNMTPSLSVIVEKKATTARIVYVNPIISGHRLVLASSSSGAFKGRLAPVSPCYVQTCMELICYVEIKPTGSTFSFQAGEMNVWGSRTEICTIELHRLVMWWQDGTHLFHLVYQAFVIDCFTQSPAVW